MRLDDAADTDMAAGTFVLRGRQAAFRQAVKGRRQFLRLFALPRVRGQKLPYILTNYRQPGRLHGRFTPLGL